MAMALTCRLLYKSLPSFAMLFDKNSFIPNHQSFHFCSFCNSPLLINVSVLVYNYQGLRKSKSKSRHDSRIKNLNIYQYLDAFDLIINFKKILTISLKGACRSGADLGNFLGEGEISKWCKISIKRHTKRETIFFTSPSPWKTMQN